MNAALLLGSALLLLASAALSWAETAVFSLRKSHLRTLVDEGFSRAGALRQLHDQVQETRPALFLVGTALNLGSLGLIIMATGPGRGLLPLGGVLFLGILVILTLGEAIPRAVASRYTVRSALLAAPYLLPVARVLRVVLRPIVRIQEVISADGNSEEGSSDEREALEISQIGQEQGLIEEDEHLLVERAFRLDEMTAWDVMTPRVDIFAWKSELLLSDIIEDLKSVPYSRVPVYGSSIDDITGVLYVREAYAAFARGLTSLPLSKLAREPFFLPGSLSLAHLLKAFQGRRIHMGIVADEFGGTDGLVTLEDVLEELVGEIVDETDVAEETIQRISRSEIVADGGADLREINYLLHVSLPLIEQRSLNGFILDEMGRVPEAGETLDLPGLSFEVLESTETQVVRARLRKTSTVVVDEGD